MRKRLIVLSSLIVALLMITGCSTKEARIEPGKLDMTKNVLLKKGKITNIVELSEKEVSMGNEILGGLTGSLIGSAISGGDGDYLDGVLSMIGMNVGEDVVKDEYGATIYKLTLMFDDNTQKEVYAKGGSYIVGKRIKATVDKKSGKVTSFAITKNK